MIGADLSFVAKSLIDMSCSSRWCNIAYPLSCRGIIGTGTCIEDKVKNFYKKLVALNYKALSERYEKEKPTEEQLLEGFDFAVPSCFNSYYETDRDFYVLSGIIQCYLYQCNEGDIEKDELFIALKDVRASIADHLLRKRFSDIDGWASIDDLECVKKQKAAKIKAEGWKFDERAVYSAHTEYYFTGDKDMIDKYMPGKYSGHSSTELNRSKWHDGGYTAAISPTSVDEFGATDYEWSDIEMPLEEMQVLVELANQTVKNGEFQTLSVKNIR